MKARQYHKFILKKQPQCHIYAIAESNGINMKHLAYFGAQLDELAKPVALNQMQELIATLHDAKEYGSIISVADYDWDLLHQFAAEFDISGEMNLFDSFGIEATQQRLQELVAVGEVLAQKYEVVVTNPPYRGVADVDVKLADYIKTNYPDSKNDLFAVFMEVCHKMNVKNGYQAMITQHAWMFLSSFEKLRAKIQKLDIVNMVHLGARAFEEIAGEVVQTTSFILANKHVDGYKGTYCRLVEPTTQQGKEEVFLAKENRYVACSDNFAKIPGAPVAYWVSENFLKTFIEGRLLCNYASPKTGMTTGNNERFLRLWSETDIKKIYFMASDAEEAVKSKAKWFPYCKGGGFRRWFGYNEYVVNWENNGYEIKHNIKPNGLKAASVRSEQLYFKSLITWSAVTSGVFSCRECKGGSLFDSGGSSIYVEKEQSYILALLNSKLTQMYLDVSNSTINYQPGDIANVPVIFKDEHNEQVSNLAKQNISLSKSDWDAFETSWDFTKHPLVVTSGQLLVNRDSSANTQLSTTYYPLTTIAQAYQRWEEETNARFAQLKANEEELNRIFIDIYGLQDELTPEVEDKDVTVRKADLQRDIKSLLSYAVGCMFGRYSLDVEGLAYAGGEFSDQWVVIGEQCYRREVVEKYVAQELQRAYGMAEVNVADGRDLSSSEVIAERGVIFTFGSDEKSSSFDSIKYRRGTSKKLYEGICELSFNSERIKCGIGNAAYDLCSPEILNAITSGSSVELVQRGWQDADSIDWQTIHYKLKTNHYGADEDNVIPITDEDYFEDDIIGRLIAWLKVVYGAETLEENLRFIADALGTSGDTARQKIRNYFLKDFFKDHCKIYQKRPIYWLYDSGKQNGFKALIYMHRYNADTSGQVRAEYLGKMEETYESEINRMQDIMDNGAGREVALAGKRKEKLQKQLHECRDYDAVLGHIALAGIAIDLDDGVKVNYVKVQTAKDGKVLPILAKI